MASVNISSSLTGDIVYPANSSQAGICYVGIATVMNLLHLRGQNQQVHVTCVGDRPEHRPEHRPGEKSGGERQRVATAWASGLSAAEGEPAHGHEPGVHLDDSDALHQAGDSVFSAVGGWLERHEVADHEEERQWTAQ
jgi:hypothetical protein